MRQRLIHFERIDSEFGAIGFYCGVHHTGGFTDEEDAEFDCLMGELFGPRILNYREYKFFFTRYGFKKHKQLVRYLLRASHCKTICWRVWKQDHEAAYEDAEQVALFVKPRLKVWPRRCGYRKRKNLK